MPRSCRLCLCKEHDPRRLIDAPTRVPRYGLRYKQIAPVHVECWLANGGAIESLSDSQLWHLSGDAWDHFHFDLSGQRARQRAADAAEARETARLMAELAAAANRLAATPDYRRGTVEGPTRAAAADRGTHPIGRGSVAAGGKSQLVGTEPHKCTPAARQLRRAA